MQAISKGVGRGGRDGWMGRESGGWGEAGVRVQVDAGADVTKKK